MAAAADGAPSSASALQVTLHPTTIINITDHYTRTLQQTKKKSARVVGGLLGTQSGRAIEIHTAFSLLFEEVDGVVQFNYAFLREKRDMLVQVLAGYEFLGWYSTTSSATPTAGDMAVMAQLRAEGLNESPLLLLVDPNPLLRDRTLPVFIFETEMRFDGGSVSTHFVSVPYRIDSGEAERIAVDHVAHLSSVAEVDSSVVAHVHGLENSIESLTERLEKVQSYLSALRAGTVAKDHRLLRQISSFLARLPIAQSPEFGQAFTAQYADVMLSTYLATLTKSADALNSMLVKHNVASERPGARQGGMF
eukprot:a510964_72.p1 GENE.a510964_72~~a510964_72.p1  ORF type:complete len:317 (-),score=162.70 a510964_72:256-1176(-)